MPIAALLPSVRPVDVLGTVSILDVVELSFELNEVSAAAIDDELDIVVMTDDSSLLGSIVRRPGSPSSGPGDPIREDSRSG